MDTTSLLKEADPKIVRLARSMSRPGIDAEDLAQEGRIAFVRMASDFDATHESGTPGLWAFAYTGVWRAMRDYIRKETRHVDDRDAPIDVADESPTPEDDLIAKERKRLFVVAIMELSEDERDLIARRFDGEDDYRKIASDLGIGLGSAHAAVKQAIENLIAKARAA